MIVLHGIGADVIFQSVDAVLISLYYAAVIDSGFIDFAFIIDFIICLSPFCRQVSFIQKC